MSLAGVKIKVGYVKLLYQDSDNVIKRGDDVALAGFTAAHIVGVAAGAAGLNDTGLAYTIAAVGFTLVGGTTPKTFSMLENLSLLDGQDIDLRGAGGEKAQLAIDTQNAERTLDLTGNITLVGNFATAGGAYALTLTMTDATNVTLPTTGTLATLAGSEAFTNKTLTTPIIASFYQDAGKTKLLTAPALSGTIVLSTAALTLAEADVLDGATAGTAIASKALVVDGSKDINGINILSADEIRTPLFNVHGISWDESQATGGYTRIGNTDTPIQDLMKRCILDDNGNVVYYCNTSDSRRRENPLTTGTADGTTGDHLIDSTTDFSTESLVQVNDYVYNTTDATFAKVTAVADGDLTLDTDIFVSGEGYEIGSNLSGADGQVMVEIPRFYFSFGYSGTTQTWKISLYPFAGSQVHPAFFKDGEWVDYRYYSAYEGVLEDVSASIYANGLWLDSDADRRVNIDAATDTITAVAGAGSAWTHAFSLLEAGDKITLSNTASNNTTYTVSSATDTVVTVSEDITVDEKPVEATIETQKDWANDKLCSISGKAPINYGTRANFRTAAASRGTGWRQQDFYLTSAIQLLYLIDKQNFNSQSTIGNGLTDWSSANWHEWNEYNPIEKTGLSNSDSNATANNSAGGGVAGSYMSYRGIENFFGHLWKWVDGFNINDHLCYISNNGSHFADNTATNYIDLGVYLPASDNYQKTLQKIKDGFLPESLQASSAQYITDFYYQSTGWRVSLLGGCASGYGAMAGVFCWILYNASASIDRVIGGRLCF